MSAGPHRPTWLRRHGLTLFLVLVVATMVLVTKEQAKTIASQRDLIRDLFRDSVELGAVKGKLAHIHQQTPSRPPVRR